MTTTTVDPTTTTVTTTEPNPADPAAQQGDPAGLTDAGRRALDVEREARAAAEQRIRDLEAKVQENENAKLSAQERAERERDDARTEAAKSADTLARYEAAEKSDLPLSWAKRLVGSTPAELEADAKAIKADLAARTVTPTGKPKPDPSQGHGGGDGAARPTSVNQAREQYLASRQQK